MGYSDNDPNLRGLMIDDLQTGRRPATPADFGGGGGGGAFGGAPTGAYAIYDTLGAVDATDGSAGNPLTRTYAVEVGGVYSTVVDTYTYGTGSEINGEPTAVVRSSVDTAQTFAVSSASSGSTGVGITVTFDPAGSGAWPAGTVLTPTITGASGLTGTWSPTSRTLGGGVTASQTFTFTPTAAGTGDLTATAVPGITASAVQAFTATASSFVLDDLTNQPEFAFSTAKLKTGISNILAWQVSGGGSSIDAGPVSSGDPLVNAAAIGSAAGASIAIIRTLYNQGSYSGNLSQSTDSLCPQIVAADDSLITPITGTDAVVRPAIVIPASGARYLTLASVPRASVLTGTNPTDMTLTMVLFGSSANRSIFWGTDGTRAVDVGAFLPLTSDSKIYFDTGNATVGQNRAVSSSTIATPSAPKIITLRRSGGSVLMRVNGADFYTVSGLSGTGPTETTNQLAIFQTGGTTNMVFGAIVWWARAAVQADYEQVETRLNAIFKCY